MRRVRHAGARLLHHVGRRGAYLLFLALLDLIFGKGLTTPLPYGLAPQTVYRPFLAVAPLQVWAAWWVAAGLMCAVATFVHRAQSVTFGAAVLLKMVWATVYLYGWAAHLPGYERGVQSATIWITFGLLTLLISGWRENGQ